MTSRFIAVSAFLILVALFSQAGATVSSTPLVFRDQEPSSLDSAVLKVVPDTSKSQTDPEQKQVHQKSLSEKTISFTPNSKNPYGLPDELMPLWKSMSIKQKAAQMVMVYMTPADFMINNEFGGYLVMKSHLQNLVRFSENIEQVNSAMRIPPLVAIDQEGGIVNRASAISPKWNKTPSAKVMRTMKNEDIEDLAKGISFDLRHYGVNVNLAPVLDPSKDSRNKNSFMEESNRSWGNDTTNANKVRSFVSGMKSNGIICASKHFPGYDSWTNSDLQIAVSATPVSRIQKNIELFKALSDDIPITMMSSVRFIRISNKPAVFEPKIVQMARDMSPETIILTDDLWGVSLRAWVSGTERVKGKNYPAKDFNKLVTTALTAGNDMFMITYPQKGVEMVRILVKLSKQGANYKKRIEESAARILKLKYRAGILNPQKAMEETCTD
ncbi:MAG: hypothetical protein MJZ26_05610 [Fibrobacter sp.]|nr:hypothetical protein [Fibrobacter sp.]